MGVFERAWGNDSSRRRLQEPVPVFSLICVNPFQSVDHMSWSGCGGNRWQVPRVRSGSDGRNRNLGRWTSRFSAREWKWAQADSTLVQEF